MGDTCKHNVPKAKHEGTFKCSFALNADGTLYEGWGDVAFRSGGVYYGNAEDLPNLPLELLLKAAGLSAMSLVLPLVCICSAKFCRTSKLRAREIFVEEDVGPEASEG